MSGRRGGLRLGREGYSGGDGGGYDYHEYGYEYFTNSYGSSPGGAHMGGARDSSYYDRNERNRYNYSESDGGYGRRRELCPPPPAQTGWGDPRGDFRGNFGSPPPVRGAGHLAPLLDQGGFQEKDGFQDLRAFTGNSYFGGGIKQRTKSWKKKMSKDKGQPAVKKMRTENNKAKSDEAEGDGNAEEPAQSSNNGGDGEDAQEVTESKPKFTRRHQENPGRNIGDRMIERIQFVCSLCKFRTFYDEEMNRHLQSNFHKDHFRYLGSKLQQQEADFLQDYVMHKTKKTTERRTVIKNLSTTIQQIYRSQDLTQELGMEQFVKKVEAAHCAACDVFIPMNPSALQQHLKSAIHKQKCRVMMETSKKNAVAVARGILNNKQISQKLEQYKKGQNPFTDENEANTRSGGSTEILPDAQESEKLPCSSLSDSDQALTTEQCNKDEETPEDTAAGQDNGQENAEDSSCALEGVEDAEVDAPDQEEEKSEMEESCSFTEDPLP